MFVKLMGVMDIFTALIIVLFQFQLIHNPLVVGLAMYLIMKAVVFFGDFFSILDGIVGLYMVLMIAWTLETVSFIVAGYLIVKGFVSLI